MAAQVLLVSSLRRPDRWVLPAGKVEVHESTDFRAAALRETEEEAGALGTVLKELERDFEAPGSNHRTRYFLLRVERLLAPADYEEGRAGRRRRWFRADECASAVSKPSHREALEAAIAALGEEPACEEPARKTGERTDGAPSPA